MHISKLVIAVLALLAASSTAGAGGAVKGFPNEYESHQYKGYGECPNGEVCELIFDDVPSGAVLMATNINCFFYTEDNPAPPFANLSLYEGASIQQSNERSNFIAPLVSANSYVVNESIRNYFYHRPKAHIDVRTTAPAGANCTLSGTLLR